MGGWLTEFRRVFKDKLKPCDCCKNIIISPKKIDASNAERSINMETD